YLSSSATISRGVRAEAGGASASVSPGIMKTIETPATRLRASRAGYQRGRGGPRPPILGREERAREKDRHLTAGRRFLRTVVAAPAAPRDAPRAQLLDPRCEGIVRRHVGKDALGRRRDVRRTLVRFQKEDRHLRACDRRGDAVRTSATA